MKFSPSVLDDIRARLPVSAVVGRRVKLRKQGREWRGLSPFNAEKTPSFYVNDQKGFYHCFSSGKHGDIFRFLMETEGLAFPEAVERLAAEAGVELPEGDARRTSGARRPRATPPRRPRARRSLLRGAACRRARAPLLAAISPDRGLTPSDPGRVPARLCARARSSRCATTSPPRASTREAMIEAGLLVHGGEVQVPYDRFRDRVMFPIHDAARQGHRVRRSGASEGRAGEIPELARRRRSSTRAPASTTITAPARRRRKPARVIAVEGYVDVISMSAGRLRRTPSRRSARR